MIRVFTASESNAITLTIDGQLVGEYVEAVETSTQEAMKEKRPVRLILRDVSHIDERGRTLLALLAAKGVQLSATGVYSSYIVETSPPLSLRHLFRHLPKACCRNALTSLVVTSFFGRRIALNGARGSILAGTGRRHS
jgi:ABC-type transporter Mla MlaB component